MTRISPPTNPDDFDTLASEGEEPRRGLWRLLPFLDRGLARMNPAEPEQFPNVDQQPPPIHTP